MHDGFRDNINSDSPVDSDHPPTSLSDIATILRSPLFKNQSSREGDLFHVASIKDYPVAGYLPVPQRQIRLTSDADRAKRYILHPFDLLVVTVGSIGHVTVVPEDCEDAWIPATNMYVVRFHEDVARRARAIYGYFKSPAGQSTLEELARGRGIQIVPKKVFEQILVPKPTEELIAFTEALWKRENTLYRESQNKLSEAQQVYEAYHTRPWQPKAG